MRKSKRESRQDLHGGILLCGTKESSLRAFREAKQITCSSDLNLSRLGSISFLMPHVLKKEDVKPGMSREHMEYLSEINMMKSATWDKTDLLICTPERLAKILEQETKLISLGSKSPLKITSRLNPAFMIFLDFEHLFSSKDALQNLRPILRQFLGNQRSDMKADNTLRKVRDAVEIPRSFSYLS